MSLINLTPAQLRHAADLKEKIEALQHELSHLHGAPSAVISVHTTAPARRAKRTISAAGIARIRAAQKARWAKVKGSAPAAKAEKPAKAGRRKMSAAGRAKIAAAARARWARVRAAKGGK
jgi:hypothetical protein